MERLYIALVACTVSVYLSLPKLNIRFWQSIILTVLVAVPKAAMNKNNSFKTAQHYVRASGKFLVVQTITKTLGMKKTTHKHFRLGVVALYCGHAA